MNDLLDWLLSNPIFFLLVAIGILGNLGGSAKKKRARSRRPSESIEPVEPFETIEPRPPPEPPPVPRLQGEEEIARRIREMFGQPAEVEPEAPPWLAEAEADVREPDWSSHEEEAEASTHSLLAATTDDGHLGEKMQERSHLSEQRRLPSQESRLGKPGASVALVPVPDIAATFTGGMTPRQAFFAMMVLGPPRGVRGYDEDAAGLP